MWFLPFRCRGQAQVTSPGGPGPLRASSQAGSTPVVQGLFTGPRRLFRNAETGFLFLLPGSRGLFCFVYASLGLGFCAEISQPRPCGLTVKHSEAEGHPADRVENCQVFRNNLGVS